MALIALILSVFNTLVLIGIGVAVHKAFMMRTKVREMMKGVIRTQPPTHVTDPHWHGRGEK
jgi:hypothetical protein